MSIEQELERNSQKQRERAAAWAQFNRTNRGWLQEMESSGLVSNGIGTGLRRTSRQGRMIDAKGRTGR